MENDALTRDLPLRLERITGQMQAHHIDAVIIASNINLLYAAGTVYCGYCYIHADGQIQHFVTKRTPRDPADAIPVRKPELIPDILRDLGIPTPRTLWLEEDEIGAGEYLRLSALFPGAQTKTRLGLLRRARMVKTPLEQQHVRTATRRQNDVYEHIPQIFEPGMDDVRLSIEIEHRLRLAGFDGLFRAHGFRMEAHMGLLLAGPNAQQVSPYDFALGGHGLDGGYPFGQSGVQLAGDMSVMVDLAYAHRGYLADTSRTFSLGKLPERAHKLHRLSCDILRAVCARAQVGTPACDLYKTGLRMAEDAGELGCYMGLSSHAPFLGHGVGLAINELPILTARDDTPLAPGMTIAVEPKFIVGDTGAVGAENTYLMTEEGLTCLSHAPEEIRPLG